jgi:nicotinamidase-related amidase
MALTTLDPKTALIVIDLQRGVAAAPTVRPVAGIVERANQLIGAFRRHGLPVVLVTVAGSPPGRTEGGAGGRQFPDGYAELIDELDRRPGDHLVTKHTRSAFARTGLAGHLESLGVTQVVLTGISTSSGVESTARDAHELGFNVTLAVDAMTDTRPASHDYSIGFVFPRIGETGTTDQVIDLLDQSRCGRASSCSP